MEQDKPIKNSISQIRLPLLISLTLASGIFLGATLFGGKGNKDDVTRNFQKFREVISYIQREYVDTVNVNDLTDYSIAQMLERLDPHSAYIPIKEVQLANIQLEGDFDGIGVEFIILQDTIQVVTPIVGGPSEQVGIHSGDRIIKVDDKQMAGVKVSNRDVFTMLRGPRGTKVKVNVVRRGESKPIDFVITRDKIPTHSIDVAYMMANNVGYIKISRFAANTADEFHTALMKLKSQGSKKLIIDVRDNPGGYMDRATRIANELLPDKRMIVYTKSKDGHYDQEIKANTAGDFENGAVIVLINEGSASASEILSGAVQDNDRGLIVGRRSFGKGLVQMPINLSDGSELRLTISRYYTPSGRSIQKPYAPGGKDYEMDFEHRLEHGEFFSADSIKFNDSLKYKTLSGRTVYGGGGIMPDVFIGIDTTMNSRYMAYVLNKNVLREFALNYANDHRAELKQLGLQNFLSNWKPSDEIVKQMVNEATKAGITYDDKQYKHSEKLLLNYLKAFIGRGIWAEEGFYPVLHQLDEVVQRANKLWAQAETLETPAKSSKLKPKKNTKG